MRGSRTFLEIGERVKIKDLLRGIIIQSGNDASVAIAECLSGTENDFAILMNSYAKQLGMKNSNFINSSGWPNDNHFSTAYDIAMLSNSIIRDFPDLYNFFNEKEFKYNNIEQPNRNKLLDYVDGADGLKTGYTKLSGWGMAGSAKRNNRRVTVVINGTNSSRSRLTESSNLLNWAFSQTFQKKLISKNQIIKNVDVWLGKKHSVNLVAENDVVSTLSYDQLKLIESEITYSSPLPAKINIGEKLGLMTIKISGKPEIKINLVSEETIGKTNPLIRIFSVIKYLIFGSSLDE
jgi:D-alanyl-D-alanine carboxypeptidase (penicillin-binding protein 5/6)